MFVPGGSSLMTEEDKAQIAEKSWGREGRHMNGIRAPRLTAISY
jgi:hypothetical protein